MESASLRLIVTHGPNIGHEYILQEAETTIGRSTNNGIVLPSPEISRRHAHLWHEGDAIFLEDLGSTNGTFVNNTRLYDRVELYDGDEIQVGDAFRLLFTSPGGVTRPTALVSNEADVESQPEAASGEMSNAYPALEIPTSKPPLFTNLDEQGVVVEQPARDDQGRPMIVWIAGAALLLITICFLALLFLDSYDQGSLLYCGSLKPLFSSLLGPFGFNPICP